MRGPSWTEDRIIVQGCKDSTEKIFNMSQMIHSKDRKVPDGHLNKGPCNEAAKDVSQACVRVPQSHDQSTPTLIIQIAVLISFCLLVIFTLPNQFAITLTTPGQPEAWKHPVII